MKIVFTIHTYWPKKNGVQYVNQYLAEGLVKKGHEVVIITSHKNSKKTEITEHNGVKIISLYLKTYYSFINLGAKQYQKNVMKELEDCDCVINSCVQSPNNNLLLPLLKKMKCKKILYMHGMHDFKHVSLKNSSVKYVLWHTFMNVRWKLFYWWNKNNFCLYDEMIDIHETSLTVEFMKKLGYPKKMNIIHNAVEDFEKITVSEEDIAKNPFLGEKYFVYVANYNERKNQKMAVKAFNAIKDKKNYKLVLIGNACAYQQETKELVESYGLKDEVLVLDNVDRDTTKKYIKNAACGLMSSNYEVYPIFIAEIMSCRKPFISTDVGCIREMPGGIVVDNVSEMAQAMQKIIDDNSVGEMLAKSGYEYALENYSQQEKIDELESLIASLIG